MTVTKFFVENKIAGQINEFLNQNRYPDIFISNRYMSLCTSKAIRANFLIGYLIEIIGRMIIPKHELG